MANEIRIAAGTVDAYDLLSTDSYLVSEWTRTSDMPPSVQWSATQPDKGVLGEFIAGLGKGTGGFYGGVSGVIEFFLLTPLMREYLETTLLGGNGIATVTAYLHNPRLGDNSGFAVYQGELLSPYIANSEAEHTRFNNVMYSNNQYLFKRGELVTISNLLLESGDYLLLETGDKLSLETQ
jgi:hypothetical protein